MLTFKLHQIYRTDALNFKIDQNLFFQTVWIFFLYCVSNRNVYAWWRKKIYTRKCRTYILLLRGTNFHHQIEKPSSKLRQVAKIIKWQRPKSKFNFGFFFFCFGKMKWLEDCLVPKWTEWDPLSYKASTSFFFCPSRW